MDRQSWVENFKRLAADDRRRAVAVALGKIMPIENEDADLADPAPVNPRAASIANSYGDADSHGTAGEHIRSQLDE
jgi:hypothetical protein